MFNTEELRKMSADILKVNYPIHKYGDNHLNAMIWSIWADLHNDTPMAEKIRLALVRINGLMLAHINNPSDQVKRTAFSNDVDAIRYMKDQPEDLQLRAVKKKAESYAFIKNPTEAVNDEYLRRSASYILMVKNPTRDQVIFAIRGMLDYQKQFIEPTIRKYEDLLGEEGQIALAPHIFQNLRYFTNISMDALKVGFEAGIVAGSREIGWQSLYMMSHLSDVLSREQKVELFCWNNSTMHGYGYDESIIRENVHYVTDPILARLFVQTTEDDDAAMVAVMRSI
jgi:hypothetical protein